MAHKINCELTLKDGTKIGASLEAESAQGRYPIIYSGAIEKLPRKMDDGDADVLKILFQNIAKELGAKLVIKEEGFYDMWAE